MKLSRTALTGVSLGVALLAGTATTAVAAPSPDRAGAHPTATPSSVSTTATIPGVGQTWLADFGNDGPWGPFAAEITFESAKTASFVVTKGALQGSTDTVSFTTTAVRPGLYVLRWHEPKSGAYVTHIEDWAHHSVVTSIVSNGQFVEMDGTFTLVKVPPVRGPHQVSRTRPAPTADD